MKHNLEQFLISIDQCLYCFFGLLLSIVNKNVTIYADMTISAQMYRLASKGYWYGKLISRIINCIFLNAEHCKQAYESELSRNHIPSDMHK